MLDDVPSRPSSPGKKRLFPAFWRGEFATTAHSDHAARGTRTTWTISSDTAGLADGLARYVVRKGCGLSGRTVGAIPPNMRPRMTFDAFKPHGNGG